jgi:AraC-like DNA-binding protein
MKYFSGINIINTGNNPECKNINQRKFPDYWGIQYNHHGNFMVSIDNASADVINGPCVLLTRPGFLYLYGSPKGESRHHSFVCFNGSKIKKYIAGGLLPKKNGQQLFPITHPEIFYKRFMELKNLLPETQGTTDSAVHLLEGLLLLMHQTGKKELTSGHLIAPFKKLCEEIREKPELDWDFFVEADTINISYMHFRRAFREHIGIPPGKYLQHCRLDKAAEQLLTSNKQIGRIAEEAGFEDQQYFSRAFKQYIQLTPSRYRKEFGVF